MGIATKYLVHIEEMAAYKSILPIVYAKKEPVRILKHISRSNLNQKGNKRSLSIFLEAVACLGIVTVTWVLAGIGYGFRERSRNGHTFYATTLHRRSEKD
jgi:hypothetical protein